MMITIGCVLKSMENPMTAVAQRNALTSWMKLSPTPELFVFGNQPGAADLAREVGATFVPDLAQTETGSDRMDTVIAYMAAHGKYDLQMYINADILLPPDFLDVVRGIDCENYLLIGERWNTALDYAIDFTEAVWWTKAQAWARGHGSAAGVVSVDYFVHQRGAFGELPPMPAGGYFTDNTLIDRALDLGIPVIDASQVMFAIHQNHAGLSTEVRHALPEAVTLRDMLKRGAVNLAHATHRLFPVA